MALRFSGSTEELKIRLNEAIKDGDWKEVIQTSISFGIEMVVC
jgi:hypothetical protein